MMQPVFDFSDFPRLSAARVLLCPLEPEHAADVFAFRSDPEVQLYNSSPHGALGETLALIEEEREAYHRRQALTWALVLKSSARVVGLVSVFEWDRRHRHANLGYELARAHWGQGLAREALLAVLRFGFEHMALHRFEIRTSLANARSLRLAERLGFWREGTLRERILEDDGAFYDCAVFGLLREAWERSALDAPLDGPA